MGRKSASYSGRFPFRFAGAIALLVCIVSSCGFLGTDPDVTAAEKLKQELTITAYGDAAFETIENRIHIVSSGAGEAGLVIEATNDRPLIVRFAYRGAQPLNLRLKRGETLDYRSASTEEFILLGSDEAEEALFYTAGPLDIEVEIEEISTCGKNNYVCPGDGKVARTLSGAGLKDRIVVAPYGNAHFESVELRSASIVRNTTDGEFGALLKLAPGFASENFVLEFEVDEPEQVQLRIDRNGQLRYHSATRGWARLNGHTEVLLFSGTNNPIHIRRLNLVDCRTGDWRCSTNEDFFDLLPGDAVDRSTARLIALTEWVAQNADYAASQSVANEMQITGLTPSQIYYRYYEPNAGGGYCGATAVFLARTLRSQGYDAFTIDFGLKNDHLTHVTTIVPFGDEFYLMDATFGAYFAKPGSEQPIDIFEVIDGAPYTFKTLSMSGRDFIVAKRDRKRLARMKQLNLMEHCEAVKGHALIACEQPGFGLDAYLSSFDAALKRNNLESSPQTVIELLRRGLFGIGDTEDTEAMRRFARALDARKIELIETDGHISPRRFLEN